MNIIFNKKVTLYNKIKLKNGASQFTTWRTLAVPWISSSMPWQPSIRLRFVPSPC